LVVGFCLPIFLFVVGCWLRRDQVRAVVAHPAIRSERRVMRAAVWLVPVFLVGTAVILLSRTVGSLANMDMVFFGARSAERRSRWSLGPCVPSQCVTVTVPSAVQAAASVRHRWCRRGPLNIDHSRELEQRIGRGEPLHFRQKLSPSTVTQSNERRPGIVQSRYRRATGSKHLRDA
jgi:hypothetical protein